MAQWLFFALLTPVLWGFTNVTDAVVRRHFIKNDHAQMWATSALRLPFVIAFFLIWGVHVPSFEAAAWMTFGGILWMSPIFLYFRAIEFEEPSRVALFFQMLPIFALTVAWLLIGETLSPNQLIAFALLIIGGTLAAVKRLEGKFHFSRAFFLITAASFVWAVSDVIFKKYEVFFDSFFNAFSFYFFGGFLVSLFWLFNKKARQSLSKHLKGVSMRGWVIMLITSLAGVSGTLTFAYALTLGKVSLTAVLIGVQPLIVLLWGPILACFIPEVETEDLSKRALAIKGLSLAIILIGLLALGT